MKKTESKSKVQAVKGSNTFGSPSKLPCDVCGGFQNNQTEPRFGYVVCEAHQNTKPVDIPRK